MAGRADCRPGIHRNSDSRRGPSAPEVFPHGGPAGLGYAHEARFWTSASTSMGWRAGRVLLARMGAWPRPRKRLWSCAVRPAGSATAFATPTATRLDHTRVLYAGSLVPVKPMVTRRLIDQRSPPGIRNETDGRSSGPDEYALFAFKHLAHRGSLEHPVLVRRVTLELTYRQFAAQAPTIEHQRVWVAN